MNLVVEDGKVRLKLSGRVDSRNAATFEDEVSTAIAVANADDVILDAAELDYISSAGLRTIMRLIKRCSSVMVDNANAEVYEVLDVTGFTDLMEVRKRLREVSIEGLELIGQGGFGKVYRLDPETIVKVYAPGCTREFVEGEREQSRKAFVMGVPTAIPFDLVRVGDCYGTVSELLDSRTASEVIAKDPSRVSEIATRMADLLLELHAIEVTPGVLQDRREKLVSFYRDTFAPYLTVGEVEAIVGWLEAIPRRTTFIHGDFHTKNVMVTTGGLMLIDIGEAAFGHPVFEWAEMALAYVLLPRAVRAGMRPESLIGFPIDLTGPLWDIQAMRYFGFKTNEEVGRFTRKIMPLVQMSACYMGASIAGLTEENLRVRADTSVRRSVLPAIASEPVPDLFWLA